MILPPKNARACVFLYAASAILLTIVSTAESTSTLVLVPADTNEVIVSAAATEVLVPWATTLVSVLAASKK
jgi:L-asparagine transporter-like permease